MRHYYDSREFPFLSDLLFSQLLNFDWESSRKELEKKCNRNNGKDFKLYEKCNGETCKKDKNRCDYLKVLDETWNNDIRFYSPKFELNEEGVYVYKTTIPREVKPSELKIEAGSFGFYVGYEHETENGGYSSASTDTLPDDLDIDSMKAVLKGGELTITANQLEKKEKAEGDDEVEYEIEIGK